ncbi:MAG: MerR family transcriptional regulator [Actinobacteria bacterium]|nr:MerR family transcriptional regulator [Actinomycetota bacterium]
MADKNGVAKPLRVSDLERISGVNRSSIHYYVREGLLTEPVRTGKTMAYYSSVHLEELEEVRRLLKEGYPISFIKKIMQDNRENRDSVISIDEKPEDRKDKILDKAVDLFSRNGYHKTRMSDIAEAVGISRSAIYLDYSSKKTLFLECIDRVLRSMLLDIQKDVLKVDDTLGKIEKTAEVVLKSYPHLLEILRVLDDMAAEDPSLAPKRKEIYETGSSVIEKLLEAGKEQGLIPPDTDLTMQAFILLGIAQGYATLMSINDHYSVDDLVSRDKSVIVIVPNNSSS